MQRELPQGPLLSVVPLGPSMLVDERRIVLPEKRQEPLRLLFGLLELP